MNKKESVIWKVEMEFKKSFCWRPFVSNNEYNFAEASAKNQGGQETTGSSSRVENDIFFGLK